MIELVYGHDSNASGPLRIAILAGIRSPWAIAIANSLAEGGHVVTFISLEVAGQRFAEAHKTIACEGARRLRRGGVNLVWAGPHSNVAAEVLRLAIMLRRVRRRDGFDICVCLYGGVLATAAFLSGVRPYAVYWMGSDIHQLRGWLKSRLFRAIGCNANLNFANGYSLAALGRNQMGVPCVMPLYHGIDCDQYNVGTGRVAGPSVKIIVLRSFEAIYDNATIVRAFAAALTKSQGHRIEFGAHGSLLNQARELWAAICPEGQEDAAAFRGGYGQSELLQMLREGDVYVSMSYADGTSTSLLEAMAAGLYPILSDIPANREWFVTHGCIGKLVPVGDANALEQALVTAMSAPYLRERAAAHNAAIVRRLADSKTSRDVLVAALRRVVLERHQIADRKKRL